ncbi:kinase-like domain-containing protein [Rhizophagus clarus]|uniref:Kinase-like domain-containing protein n=1 Tax=Rhizophagus clarus TaxID=94130 RepID=A0A8H3LW10_9GLOM|nr:kinase-like domain-containing protein [Rhizophagus clarus]
MSHHAESELINQVEDAISKKYIKFYEYEHFGNVQEIGSGNFGKVYRAEWRNSDQYLALKSFFNLDNITIKELIHEIELQREVAFHDNIINFYGITTNQEFSCNKMTRNYLLVMEYANGGSLRNYLKNNFESLSWEDKYRLAYQLACAVLCLHSEGIVHCDLHSGNVLIHENNIKLADFGLSRRIEALSKKQSDLFGIVPYIEPKKFKASGDNQNSLNQKSDVYSFGVLLWEISSGQRPFCNATYDAWLATQIYQGRREKPIDGTPIEYTSLYNECWDGEPDNRPSMVEVVKKLKPLILKSHAKVGGLKIVEEIDDIENPCIKSSQLIKSIQVSEHTKESMSNKTNEDDEIKELVNKIVELIFKEIEEEKDQNIKNQNILDNLNSNKITLLEIYNWLRNNQNEPNFVFLLGYFNYFAIGTNGDNDEAFKLFVEASKENHILSQYYVGLCYEFGHGTRKDEKLAFKYFKKIADENYALGQLKTGYFYYKGINTRKDLKKAFNWYQKAANNGNLVAMFNLGKMYKNGEGVDKDIDKAIYWCDKSIEGGNQNEQAQKFLGKLMRIKNRKNRVKCTVT